MKDLQIREYTDQKKPVFGHVTWWNIRIITRVFPYYVHVRQCSELVQFCFVSIYLRASSLQLMYATTLSSVWQSGIFLAATNKIFSQHIFRSLLRDSIISLAIQLLQETVSNLSIIFLPTINFYRRIFSPTFFLQTRTFSIF